MAKKSLNMQIYDMKHIIGLDQVSTRDGITTIRRSFFYGINNGDAWADRVMNALKAEGFIVERIENGTQFKPFRGGDSVAKGSHYWLKVKVLGRNIA